jgi:hypothetical protein
LLDICTITIFIAASNMNDFLSRCSSVTDQGQCPCTSLLPVSQLAPPNSQKGLIHRYRIHAILDSVFVVTKIMLTDGMGSQPAIVLMVKIFTLSHQWCVSSAMAFTPFTNVFFQGPIDGRTNCSNCTLPYFAHSHINISSTMHTPAPLPAQQSTLPMIASASLHATSWTPTTPNVAILGQTTNDRRMQAAELHRATTVPSGVARMPFNAFPTVNITQPTVPTLGTSSKQGSRGRSSTGIRYRRNRDRSITYQYKVIIHPEPVSALSVDNNLHSLSL